MEYALSRFSLGYRCRRVGSSIDIELAPLRVYDGYMYTSRHHDGTLGNDGHEVADVTGDVGDWISHLSVQTCSCSRDNIMMRIRIPD